MAKAKQKLSRSNKPHILAIRIPSTYHITPEGLEIVKKLESIMQESSDTQKRLRADHPNWTQTDARLTVFSKLHNGLRTISLSVIFIETSLQNSTWWNENFNNLSQKDIDNYKHNFALSTKHSFGMLLFIQVENYFRIFLRAIDPDACKSGTGTFETIYTCLLRFKLSYPPPESFELLELIRFVRNTIHNDGIYLHKNGQDTVVIYKGVNYAFNNGKPINFVTWEFLLMVATDIQNLIAVIVSNNVVADISGQIIDPTYNA